MNAENVCHICQTTEELEVYGEFHLCNECRDEHLKQCSYCGEYFTSDDYVTDCNGDIYCESCRDDHLSWCERCNEYYDSDHFEHIENLDEYWCFDCSRNHAYHCEHCGDWVSENYGDSNTTLCSDCYENHYSTCDDCGEVFHHDSMYCHDDGTYCEYCNENHSSSIHQYSYEPYLNFLSSDKDDENRLAYLGFELEAGGVTSSERNRIADEISDGEDTFYLKEDGSIPEYGFELVSHPITLKRHKELNWDSILAHLSHSKI